MKEKLKTSVDRAGLINSDVLQSQLLDGVVVKRAAIDRASSIGELFQALSSVGSFDGYEEGELATMTADVLAEREGLEILPIYLQDKVLQLKKSS